MKKGTIITVIVVALIAALSTYIVTIKLNDNDNQQAEKNNNEKTENNDKILSLTNEQLDKYLDEINNRSNREERVFLPSFISYYDIEDYDYKNLRINVNLFDDVEVKNRIAIIIGNLPIEVRTHEDSENLDTFSNYLVDKELFSKVYKETWDEEVTNTSHKEENGKIIAMSDMDGLGIHHIEIKAKGISLENDTYVIKTSVGIYDSKKTDYNYDNNYEGQIKFKVVNGKYRILSYIIVEK